jgi:hypothetical protein
MPLIQPLLLVAKDAERSVGREVAKEAAKNPCDGYFCQIGGK